MKFSPNAPVSVRSLRNHIKGTPWIDWLDRHGEAAGFEKDQPNLDLDYGAFIREKGIRFHEAFIQHLETLSWSIRHLSRPNYQQGSLDIFLSQTADAMREGSDVIVGATLADPVAETYGFPDLLIRSDRIAVLYHLNPKFEGLFGSPWANVTLDRPAPSLGTPFHYVPLDIRFATLSVGSKGRLTGSERPQDQVAAICHARALQAMQGVAPGVALLAGRVVKEAKAGRSVGSLDWPALVDLDNVALSGRIEAAIAWQRRLADEGKSWTLIPPSVPELAVGKVHDGAWHSATAAIAALQSPETNEKTESSIVAELLPGDWEVPAEVEFFVDFETFNNLDDDFRSFPAVGGQSLLFMIGCYHESADGVHFECFIAEDVTPEAEAHIVDAWMAHMAKIADGRPTRVVHWSNAEPQFFRHNYDSVTSRHGEDRWADPAWFDFCAELRKVRKSGNGLKEVGGHLHRLGAIPTKWIDEGVLGGTAAQVAAWRAYEHTKSTGEPVVNHDYMIKTRQYNYFDVKVMAEVVAWFRAKQPIG
jgi:hypothetical protein